MQDLTSSVADVLAESGLQNGVLTLFCPSATSAVTTIEYESGALSDFRRLFDEIANPDRHYAHNARWDDGNGLSQRVELPALSVPFVKARLTLGTWQRILYVDFDNRPRQRELVVQMIGE
jgi:secondary thiamine-phosphate synthase enzyme